MGRWGLIPGNVRARRASHSAAVAAVFLGCLLAAAGPARANSTVHVNTTSDSPTSSQCSLRDAVMYANGSAEPSCASASASGTTTIILPAGTYTLTGSELPLTGAMVIDGAGAASTKVSGGGAVRVMNVAASSVVTLTGVTITGGVSGVNAVTCTGTGSNRSCPSANGLDGGGIYNLGTLKISNSAVTGNAASSGTTGFSSAIQCLEFGCTGANGGNGGRGGGIYNDGTLSIRNSKITANAAGDGADGGTARSGASTSANGNRGGNGGTAGDGGGIYNFFAGTLSITGTTISGNHSGKGGSGGAGSDATSADGSGGYAGDAAFGGAGGGIFFIGTTTPMSISLSTISGNLTGNGGNGASGGAGMGTGSAGVASPSLGGGNGAGIFSQTSLTLGNDTLSGNRTGVAGAGASAGTSGGGGAALQDNGGTAQLVFVTVAGNTDTSTTGGGTVANNGGTMSLQNSIVAGNVDGNCSDSITDAGNNVTFGDATCPGVQGDPRLGPLTSANGGQTATMALRTGSPAINLVPLAQCSAVTDQRGIARPQSSACDAGAYEFAPPAISGVRVDDVTPLGVTVSATVDPNLSSRGTQVLLRYGATSAYGLSAPAKSLGNASRSVPVSFNLQLKPGTLYHADLVATNGDGAAVTSDFTFRTPPAGRLVLKRLSRHRKSVSLTIRCRGVSKAICEGPITLSARHSGRRISVGTGSYDLPAGQTDILRIRLNSAGRRLLRHGHKLRVTVALRGTSHITRHLRFP